jgi:hypothetical protein
VTVPPRPCLPSPRRRLAAALVALGLLAAPGAPPAAAADDLEPTPPPIFFPEPDPQTAEQIEDLIDNSFGDQNKVVAARETLVRRYGLVSLPALVRRVESGGNEAETWNAALAIGMLRAALGPAPEFAPAIAPLTRLLKAAEPWRRTFAALALGAFHGPDSIGTGSSRRAEAKDDPRARHRAALNDATHALVAALSDDNIPVRAAAALALGKVGGMTTWHATIEKMRSAPHEASTDARVAALLCLGLLPGSDETRPALALKDEDRHVRAAAALAIALRHVAVSHGGAPRDAQAAGRAASLDARLRNAEIRTNEVDGAEATYARGALGYLAMDPNAPVWADLYRIALNPATDRLTVLAAAQALLFAPPEAVGTRGDLRLRDEMAEFAGRDNVGHALKEPVLAAFLTVVGSEGTPAGVRACARYLKHVDREPRGKPDYDVRYHAAIALVRALEAGRVATPEARAEAVDALVEAARVGLPRPPPDARGLRDELRDLMHPQQRAALLSDATARLPEGSARRLEGHFRDPDALLAADAIDVVVDRLNDAMRGVFGLDNLTKAGGALKPEGANTSQTPLRFLKGWLEQRPYFARSDLRPLRGRTPAAPPPPADDPKEIDR